MTDDLFGTMTAAGNRALNVGRKRRTHKMTYCAESRSSASLVSGSHAHCRRVMLMYPLLQPSRNIIGSRAINLGRFSKPERDSGSQAMRPSNSLEMVPTNFQSLPSATE